LSKNFEFSLSVIHCMTTSDCIKTNVTLSLVLSLSGECSFAQGFLDT
jgi:hypothetical protein